MKNSFVRLFFAASIAGMLGACQTGGGVAVDPNTPVAPGSVRLSMKNPDPSKWQSTTRTPAGLAFKCRPLACADGVIVFTESQRAPTSKPDPEALRKLAVAPPDNSDTNAQLPAGSVKIVKVEKIDGRVIKIKDYPTVASVTRTELENKPALYIISHLMFAKVAVVKYTAVSISRATAEKALREFESALEITEGATN